MNKKLLEMRRKMLVEKSKYLSDYTIYGNTVVEDGVIKGVRDEVKWNQLCLMPIPTEVLPSGVSAQFATYTYSNGIGEIQRTSDTEAYRIGFNIPTTVKTDKYLIYITARAGDGEEINCSVQFDWGYASSIRLTENFKTYSVFKNPYGSNTVIRLLIHQGTKFYIKGIMIINLTEMFGAGNEPNTIEDFKSYLVSIGKMKSVEDDIPYFPYDTGSVFYKMPIVAKSKNIFTYDKPVTVSGYFGYPTEIFSAIRNLPKDVDLYIKADFENLGTIAAMNWNIRYTDGTVTQILLPSIVRKFQIDGEKTLQTYPLIIYVGQGKPDGDVTTISNIRIGYSAEDVENYTPYHEPEVYPVSLSKPLYKINDITDYASYSERGVWRNCDIINGQLVQLESPIFEAVDLPKIAKFDGITLTTDTEVKPSKIEIKG